MNRSWANTCLTDMINISIKSFKLPLNEIKKIFYYNHNHKDAFLSKGNEETASQDQQLHSCETDSENTSLLVNNSNISLLFPPDTFMVIMFAGALRQAYCVHLNTELFSCADGSLLLRDTKHRRAALDSRGSTVSCCFHQRGNFFSSLIDGCLKYKNKEKPKTGPKARPHVWTVMWKLAEARP